MTTCPACEKRTATVEDNELTCPCGYHAEVILYHSESKTILAADVYEDHSDFWVGEGTERKEKWFSVEASTMCRSLEEAMDLYNQLTT